MVRKSVIFFLVFMQMILLSSCMGGRIIIYDDREEKADNRVEQIISLIINNDRESLKSLFSEKALDEANDIDDGIDSLFNFLQGDIHSWKRDGLTSERINSYSKQSIRNNFSIIIDTDIDSFNIYVIDYNKDTINPENEGVYMLEISKTSYSGEWDSWQNRMSAGVHIVE